MSHDSFGMILDCARIHTHSHVSCAEQLCVICTCKTVQEVRLTAQTRASGRTLQGTGLGTRVPVSRGWSLPPERRLVLQQQLQLLQRQAHPQLLLRHQVHDLLHLVGEVLHGVHVQRLRGATPVSGRLPGPAPFPP